MRSFYTINKRYWGTKESAIIFRSHNHEFARKKAVLIAKKQGWENCILSFRSGKDGRHDFAEAIDI